MKKLLFFLVFTMIALLSCSTNRSSTQMDWLVGTWAQKTKRGVIYENWTKMRHEEWHGISYKLKNNDTIVLETVRIYEDGNHLFYEPTVKGQNNEQPVKFKLKKWKKSELSFVNPDHDFPQEISYRRINNDSLVATILGKRAGSIAKRYFPMKKTENK